MIALQVISKILATQSYDIIEDNLLTDEYFVGYKDEFNFISNHYKEYGNVPDKATFLSKFSDIELVEVTESNNYLVDSIREEYLYYKSIPVVQQIAKLLKSDANAAAEYMMSAMKELQPNYGLSGIDIISNAQDRLDKFTDRKDNQSDWFFTTGFEELDDLVHGLQREEELLVLFARTNQGKSWILEKICTHIWELGFNVGYISPEMSAISVGYRFDTLYKNFSNRGLFWGKDSVDADAYADYITELQSHKNKLVVSTPLDFDRKITISKIRNWVKQYKLDMIAIDGITYLSDERFKRGDNKTTTLTNISEDLMSLSMELAIPIAVVVQSNRNGVIDNQDKGTPDLESIRDSDGIAHNASKVISLRQRENDVLEMGIKKQRFGPVGGTLLYNWNIDKGTFDFIPSESDAEPSEVTRRKVERVKKEYNDKEDIF